MARYSLIIRDATYLKLLQMAASQGKTMGKLLNELLDKVASEVTADGHLAASPVCIVCGAKAVFEGHGKGQQRLFVCALHKNQLRRLNGFRQLEL